MRVLKVGLERYRGYVVFKIGLTRVASAAGVQNQVPAARERSLWNEAAANDVFDGKRGARRSTRGAIGARHVIESCYAIRWLADEAVAHLIDIVLLPTNAKEQQFDRRL
jgi:hypothetical protein